MGERSSLMGRIRVAVIGPADLVTRTLVIGNAFVALDLSGHPYEDERVAPELFRQVSPAVEAVLFTGPIPYQLAMAAGEPSVPVTYVRLRGTGLYRTLFQARQTVDLERVSVDTLSRSAVDETYRELGIPSDAVRMFDGNDRYEREAAAQFHLDQYHAGNTVAALTGLYSTSQALLKAGVPCFWVTPTIVDLRVALERAMLMGSSQQKAQVVLGVIAVEPGGTTATGPKLLQVGHEVYGALLRYVEPFEGHLFASGTHEYQFFATRDSFERAGGALHQTDLMSEVRSIVDGRVSLGIGFGRTANQAGMHARIALRRAQEEGGNKCYAVMDNRRLVGPLGTDQSVSSELRALDPQLLAVANEARMSGPALDRLYAALKDAPTFTAAEAASALGVTLRTAHRVLARLEKAGGIRVVGQEKLSAAGRPRQVFQLV